MRFNLESNSGYKSQMVVCPLLLLCNPSHGSGYCINRHTWKKKESDFSVLFQGNHYSSSSGRGRRSVFQEITVCDPRKRSPFTPFQFFSVPDYIAFKALFALVIVLLNHWLIWGNWPSLVVWTSKDWVFSSRTGIYIKRVRKNTINSSKLQHNSYLIPSEINARTPFTTINARTPLLSRITLLRPLTTYNIQVFGYATE